jgi:hypothetical protein
VLKEVKDFVAGFLGADLAMMALTSWSVELL